MLARAPSKPAPFQCVGTIAEQGEREARNRPEHWIFVTAALVGEEPTIAAMPEVGSEQQVHPQKERNPARVYTKNQGHTPDRFIKQSDLGKPAWQPQGAEVFGRTCHRKHEDLQVGSVQDKQDAHADPQEQRTIRRSLFVDHPRPPSPGTEGLVRLRQSHPSRILLGDHCPFVISRSVSSGPFPKASSARDAVGAASGRESFRVIDTQRLTS